MSGTRAGPEAAPEAAAKAAGRDSRAPGTTPSEAPLIRGPRASLARTLGLHAGNSAAARVLGEAPPRGTAVQRVLSVQDPEGKVYSKIGEPGFAAEAHMALMENEAADYEDFNGVWGNYLEHPGTFEHYLFELVKAAQDYGSFDLSKPADVQRLYFQLKPLVMGDAGSEGPDVEAEAEVEVEPEARAAQPVAPAADSPLADYEPVMLEYQQRVLAQRTAAQEMQRLYDANVDALITAATPPRMADVPDEMRAQIGEAWAQITVFEVAVHGTKEGLQRLITEGEGHFSAAVDRVAGIQTEAGFQDWLLDMARANGQFQGVAEGLRDAMKELGKHAVGFAHIGRELGDADYVAGVLQVADRAQGDSAHPLAVRPELDALAAKATLHDQRSGKFAIGDAINNSTAVVTGILGVAVTATAAAVAGTVSTAVGLVFASVGTVLAIRAAVHAHGAVGRIAAIEKYLTSEKAQSIASYAKGQKETKRNRQLGLAVLGAATVAVGIAGIASGGLILGLAGIAVAAAALGVGLWKYFHRRAKRKAEETVAKEMAAGIIEGAREGEPAAKAIFDQHRGDQRAIEAWAQHQFTEKRHHTAVDLVNMLDSEVPSERFNSETIVQSLGLAPDDIRQAALRDQAEAIGLVERKLASW